MKVAAAKRLWKLAIHLLFFTLAGGVIGYGVGEPLLELVGLVEATQEGGWLEGLAVFGLSAMLAMVGAGVGACVGVVLAIVGAILDPILKLLPIGHN